MSQSCPLPPSLLSFPAVQMQCVRTNARARLYPVLGSDSELLAAEDSLGQQIPLSKVERINGLNLEENEMPGCFSCRAIDTSSFPRKELKREACDTLTAYW